MRANSVFIDTRKPIFLDFKALPKVVTLQVIYFSRFHTLHRIEALTHFITVCRASNLTLQRIIS
jgi:hypothetical protein